MPYNALYNALTDVYLRKDFSMFATINITLIVNTSVSSAKSSVCNRVPRFSDSSC